MELEMKLSQSQVLAPQMEQSVRILQMDSMQLNEYLKEVMLENPVMEFEQPRERDEKKDLALRKLEWLESQTVREKENVGYYEEQDDEPTLEKTVAADAGESLVDHLLTQIELSGADKPLKAAARYLVGFIDENGYLTDPLEQIAQEGGCTADALRCAVTLVQGMDPAGVCASNIQECLCLQLGEEESLARRIVAEGLEEIAKNRIGALAKRLGASEQEVQAAVRRIRCLNPKPGAVFARSQPPAYITPDIVVTGFEDRYHVMLCEFSYPEIRLSPSYLRMAKESSDPEVVDYLNQKANQVNWIKKCIENRNKTLLAVAKAIVKRQERFFRYGPQYLNILRMREVAEMVALHESTVSRAVRDKYLQCAHGVYPLRHFFVKGIEGGAGAASVHDIKCRLRALVDAEPPGCALSDQKLAALLTGEGMAISRRTVAKYREELGIPKSCER